MTRAEYLAKAARPISIRGTDYPSIKAAARALNVPPSSIHNCIRRGTLDSAGLGRGNGKRKNQRDLT